MFIAPRSSFIRPNDVTPYSIGDLVANSTTAGLVERLRWGIEAIQSGRIHAVNFFTDSEVVTLATFNLHIWRSDPGAPGVGDNAGPYAIASARDFLATIACDLATGATVTATDKAKRFVLASPIIFDPPLGTAIYGLVTAGAAYVPAANELFEIKLEIEA